MSEISARDASRHGENGRAMILRVTALALLALPTTALSQLPKENVIDVPAIGDGLCVSNVFQTNMVLQRDEPIRVWGWAAPGEAVEVTFAGA